MKVEQKSLRSRRTLIFVATSALDAESETLVNSALTALLRGNNTTISIAHRLSTIKRSDLLIVLSADGRVAEQGTYKELSARSDGAFTKLMEWQMSGGDADERSSTSAPFAPHDRGPPTEAEELKHGWSSDGEGEEDVDEETLKVKKDDATAGEVVLDKAQQGKDR